MISEKLREKVEKRYGCHNHPPRVDSYRAQRGWHHFWGLGDAFPRRFAIMMDVQDRMSRECMYDRSSTDPQCAGCKHDKNNPN